MLKAGNYTIGLDSGITNNHASRAEHQQFHNLLAFDVRESFDTSLKGYAPSRGGIVAVRLNWNTHRSAWRRVMFLSIQRARDTSHDLTARR